MQPRTLDQILSELNNVYQPQIDTIRRQQADLPNQTAADIARADAAKNTAFDDITNGARQRGMGFSGIPLGEQAKYSANVYAPAILQTQTDARNKAFSLEDAINQIQQRRNEQGQSIYQFESSQAEQRRQFDAQMAAERARQAAANASLADPTLGMANPSVGGTPRGNLSGGRSAADADAAIRGLINTNNPGTIINTYKAIADSARRGNTYDQAKLQLLQRYMPGWFTTVKPGAQPTLNADYINRVAQAGQLRFRV